MQLVTLSSMVGLDLSSKKVTKDALTLTTKLSSLNIPHLGLVLEEAFSIPGSLLTGVDPSKRIDTIKDLIDQSILAEDIILKRLEGVIKMSSDIEISCEALARHLAGDEPQPVILDVREKWEFDICHIEGSLLGRELELDAFIQNMRTSGKEVIAVCHHGVRSFSAAMYLKQQGIENVKSLAGGLDRWAQVIDETMSRY